LQLSFRHIDDDDDDDFSLGCQGVMIHVYQKILVMDDNDSSSSSSSSSDIEIIPIDETVINQRQLYENHNEIIYKLYGEMSGVVCMFFFVISSSPHF
jgi:hypothetical protein